MPALTDECVAKRKADDAMWEKVADEMIIKEMSDIFKRTPAHRDPDRKRRCRRIEVSDAIIAKQMQCVKGKPEHVTVYIQQPMSGTPLIVQGLYPVANDSAETISATERDMRKTLDRNHVTAVSWNDFCVLSSTTTNKIIDQDVVATWATDPEIVADYYRRLAIQLDAVDADTAPCVFIAGNTCQAAHETAIELGLVKRITELSPLGVTVCEIDSKCFVALESRPHPSWHLMKANAPFARAIFLETMEMLNGMVRCCATGDISSDTMHQSIVTALAIDPEELQRRAEGRSFLTQLLYGNPSGRFPTKHVHLRNVKAHLPEVQAFLLKWQSRGMKQLWAILLKGGDLYLDLPSHDQVLDTWYKRLDDSFSAFICGSVASRLLDDAFMARLETWYERLGGNFQTFICNSVASRLLDDAFMARLETWYERLGDKFQTFMCNSVASRLLDDAFMAPLETWYERLGANFQAFICGSVASRLLDDAFMARLDTWYERLGDKFQTFICGSVASRLLDDAFMARLETWYERLGGKFQTFMCNGVASRLLDDAFMARLETWYERLGAKFQTFICGSVASRLLDDAFMARLETWYKRLGDKFQTFICGSVASRLLDDAFMARLETWYERLGCKFQTFVCNGVASRLLDDAFMARLETWYERLGKDDFVTFMSGSTAKAIEDDAVNQRILEWHELLGEYLCTFMCNGVASRLTDPRFLAVAARWIDRLGREHFCKIFGRNSFVVRVVEQPAFEAKVLGHFIRLSSNAKALKSFLKKHEGRKLDSI
ncbi:hypothetical protein JKP88DRAFT_240949 [Tribonema minus]|uniref:Plus3 domain-containing protein n=1 Tax=Tribonema minus TaxID=303371 RepID=A0A835Z2I7_9STRA|nr:hypothetical protein JKP88DRAFT_240949 [Tribonema minus]